MDGRTVGTDWYGTYVVWIFGTKFYLVCGMDFGPEFLLVWYVVRILVPIFFDTVRGLEFDTIIRSGTDTFNFYENLE